MKRLFAILIVFAIAFSLCACAKTSIDTDSDVTLTYIYADADITVTLEADDAQRVLDILDGNTYDPAIAGTPSCGFSKNVSLTIGSQTFAIACDTCSYVQDLSNQKFFRIADEEMEFIHSLFEKYGSHFPCL